MSPRETINDILVNLFNEIWKLEEDAIIHGGEKDGDHGRFSHYISQWACQ